MKISRWCGRKQPWSVLSKGRGADISPDKCHSRKAVFDLDSKQIHPEQKSEIYNALTDLSCGKHTAGSSVRQKL
jgi:hypothetical protein